VDGLRGFRWGTYWGGGGCMRSESLGRHTSLLGCWEEVRRMERWFRVCTMGWNWESPRGRRESVERGGGCFGVVIGGVRCGNAAGPQSLGASNGKIKKKEEGRAI